MMRRITLVGCLSVFLASPALAQQGQINGLVTDTSGAVVPGVTVTATETATGFERTAVSGSNGNYVFTQMRPAVYEIRAELNGFRTFVRKDVQLQANQALTVNVSMAIGALEESVTVAGAAATVDITTATISEVVEHERIVELPLNGRDASKLVQLTAGTIIGSISTETGKSIPGGLRLSTNGSNEKDVSFRLDGTSNNDPYFQENMTFPFPEALQEFSIETSNYSAAEGGQSGAVVNAVTRSGTNDYHGGAFGYLRNRAFNSKPFFAPERDHLEREQYGTYLGGPVKLFGYNGRNRTFFFTGWQGTLINNLGASANVFLPTDDMRNGNFATCGQACSVVIRDPQNGNQPFPNNQILVSRFDPAIVNILAQLPHVTGDGLYQIPRQIEQDMNQFVAKIDQQMGPKNQFSNRYFIDHFDNAPVFTPGNLATYRSGTLRSRVRTQNNVLSWKRTLGTVLNDVHLGFSRVHARRGPPEEGVPTLQSLGIRLPLYPTLPSLQGLPFGIGDNLEGSFIRNNFEVGNRTNLIWGKHSMQFGGDMSYYKVDIVNEYRRGGAYTFSSGNNYTGMNMADIMLGHMSNFTQGTGEYKNNRARYYSAFIHDDYKISRRVSAQLGMRWEPAPPWRELVGRFQQFRIEDYNNNVRSTLFDNAPKGLLFRGDPGVPFDGTNIDWFNIGTRLGIAYDLTGDGKTSIRGGWGMFYDQQLDGEFYNVGVNSPPWSITSNYNEPSAPFSDPYRGRPEAEFLAITPAAIGRRDAAFPAPVQANGYDDKFETPVTYNTNVTFERQLRVGWMARVGYVASRSRNERTTIQINPAIYVPGATTATTDARRALQPYGGISEYRQTGWSDYDSLQMTVSKRLSRGWSFNANYTRRWTDGQTDSLIPYFMPQDPALVLTHGGAGRFVSSWVWQLPDFGGDGSFSRHVLGGWQLTGIYQYQQGGFLSVSSGSDTSRDGLGGDLALRVAGVSLDPPAGSDQTIWFNKDAFKAGDVGTFGSGADSRNIMRGPSMHTSDMGLFKNFRLTNDLGFQFRIEAFNVFNTVNFGNPNTTVSSGSFGRITSTHSVYGDPRIIQFGLKFVY